jgi:hypothetical protein
MPFHDTGAQLDRALLVLEIGPHAKEHVCRESAIPL